MTKKMDLPKLEVTLEDALEAVDGPAELAPPDQIPHLNQDIPVATYRDWDPKDTRIVRCCIANDLYPGARYESREEARAAVELVHGRVLEANYLPGQAFFRVYRKGVA